MSEYDSLPEYYNYLCDGCKMRVTRAFTHKASNLRDRIEHLPYIKQTRDTERGEEKLVSLQEVLDLVFAGVEPKRFSALEANRNYMCEHGPARANAGKHWKR